MLATIQLTREDVPTPDAARPKGRRALELQKSRERLAGVQSRAAEAFKTTGKG